MPALLRMYCRGGMVVSPIAFVLLLLPMSPSTVNGQPVSYAELWSSGIGEIFALLISLIGIGAWGMAARSRAGRWFIVLAGLLPGALLILLPSIHKYSPGLSKTKLLAEAAATAIFLYACLFWIPSVKRYFNNEHSVP